MKIDFKISDFMLARVHADLDRPHPFASERVGFITCGIGALPKSGAVLLAAAYHPVADEHYEDDSSVGAMIGSAAFRGIMQTVYTNPACVVHVHRHNHVGMPKPGKLDKSEMSRFMPDFLHVRPERPHAALILSFDSMWAAAWVPGSPDPVLVSDFAIIGNRIRRWGIR